MTPTCDFLNARRAMHFSSSKWVSTLTLILWESQGVPSEKIRLRIFIQLKNKVFPLRLFSILNRYWPVQRPSSTDGVMSLMYSASCQKFIATSLVKQKEGLHFVCRTAFLYHIEFQRNGPWYQKRGRKSSPSVHLKGGLRPPYLRETQKLAVII